MKIDGPDQASRLTHSLSMITSGFSGVLTDFRERRACGAFLDAWKELIAGTGTGTFERVEIQLGRYRRDFGDRLRWQRWRRFGV